MLRIAITGPESTGKSTLAKTLAAHFKSPYVEEYSREYLNKLDREYEYNDILRIAKGQLSKEIEAEVNANELIICDTDLLVNKIWSEYVFGKCDPWIIEKMHTHKYNLHLLTNIDIPWEADPLREHPHCRKELFDIYVKNLKAFKLPYAIVSGEGEERVNNAILEIEKVLNEFNHTK